MATVNDRCILNSIFNPTLPLGECPIDDPNNSDQQVEDEVEVDTPEIVEVKELERLGVKCAENGDLNQAIDLFTRAINKIPTRSSGYNNRAQAYRLGGKNDEALEDLNRAVELSRGKGAIAGKSLCQRGLLHQFRGQHDQAIKDFQVASGLGNEFAKMMCIQLNPYAALCNQMLSEVLRKLKAGQPLQ